MGREQSKVNKKERKKGREGEEIKRRSWEQSANNEKMGEGEEEQNEGGICTRVGSLVAFA